MLGAQKKTLSDASGTVAAGYYAATTLSAVDADLAAANIKPGVTIFGFAGNFTSDSDAIAADIITGKTAYVNGVKLTGTLTTQSLSPANDTVTAGTYTGTTLSAVDTDLAAANIKPGVTIFGFAGTYTSDSDAVAGNIMSGKTAYVNGVKLTGTLPTSTLSAANDTLSAGYYAATTLSAVDADLAAANIKSGVTVFGKTGTLALPDTGVTGSGAAWDDGAYSPAASQPSYTDNADGTITDNRTGLMWAKDGLAAGCNSGSLSAWSTAGGYCDTLTFATYSDWRLPNVRELLSIMMYGASPIDTTYFTNNQAGSYWTSTAIITDPVVAYYVDFVNRNTGAINVITSYYVRCVRGGP
ncbi:MAG: hypothetical protein A2089_08450 [Elusimicrobia bacterium GWD2_63_28]|nr:MAG: hypothetical protein A2089_08450 [Elusimicrobia bacterium GWD2_63_28]